MGREGKGGIRCNWQSTMVSVKDNPVFTTLPKTTYTKSKVSAFVLLLKPSSPSMFPMDISLPKEQPWTP